MRMWNGWKAGKGKYLLEFSRMCSVKWWGQNWDMKEGSIWRDGLRSSVVYVGIVHIQSLKVLVLSPLSLISPPFSPTEREALGTVCLRPHGCHLPCAIHRLAHHSCHHQNSFSWQHFSFIPSDDRYLFGGSHYSIKRVFEPFGNLGLMETLTC